MASLETVYHHLVLPPKVPGGQDNDLESIQDDIIRRLLKACHTLQNVTGPELNATWDYVTKSLETCQKLNQGRLDEDKLTQAFKMLDDRQMLILYVVQQNAALLIRRDVSAHEDRVIFESFEVSPPPSAVLAAENALQWDFPGRSAEIQTSDFQKADFQSSLALFLEQASLESLESFAAKEKKAGISIIESRSTTDPALISQMLISLLEAIGKSYNGPRLRKRVRDDVNIVSSELPWRRLPFWMLLRVSLHRFLKISAGDDRGQACYKVLITMVLAHLLNDCAGKLSPESTVLLQSKICRRLAKLSDQATSDFGLLTPLLDAVTPVITPIVMNAQTRVQKLWNDSKSTYVRTIPKLEQHAQPADHALQLPNSIKSLEALLKKPKATNQFLGFTTLPKLDEAMEKTDKFTKPYIELSNYELAWSTWAVSTSLDLAQCQTNCLSLSKHLQFEKLRHTLRSLKGDPEQISSYLLTVFNIWTRIDQDIIKLCPLLQQYHPIFSPELLDTLHVSTYAQLELLRQIQSYLRRRIDNAGTDAPSILSEINKTCFAAQYFQGDSNLKAYFNIINSDSEVARTSKEEEWTRCREQYQEFTERIGDDTCVCTVDMNGDRDIRGCTKCYYIRSRKRLEIKVHEDFMPTDDSQKAAVMLELNMPQHLRDYRDATWAVCLLASPKVNRVSRGQVKIKLEDYSQLNGYMSYQSGSITLASHKKSFLDTHYKGQGVDVAKSWVLLCNPLRFAHYDRVAGAWVQDPREELTLQHICGVTSHPVLQAALTPSVTTMEKYSPQLSSYEIIANQTQCPREMSLQEFAALQEILSSTDLRWVEILREIQSPNLNFGDENTMFMVTHLVMQAGPARGSSILGQIHMPFMDSAFRELLAEQIGRKLRAIKSNPREAPCMDLLLTLSLRLFEFGQDLDCTTAETLVKDIRAVTLGWIEELQAESQGFNDLSSAQAASKYIFWASMICRRTFLIRVNACSWTKPELRDHSRASLALQMNILDDPAMLSLVPRAMFVRDAKIAAILSVKIRDSILADSLGLEEAICAVWKQSSWAQHHHFSPWREPVDICEDGGTSRWVFATLTNTVGGHNHKQIIHYSYVEGYLLIDGKAFGELPLEIRNSEDVYLLFGNQNLLTSPSPLDGMTHQLLANPRGHQLHFGFRDGNAIIRDFWQGCLREFIPKRTFQNAESYDLPSSLIDGCIHWLNISEGILEIRQASSRWYMRNNDWKVDIKSRIARRGPSTLVSPHGFLAAKIGRIFQGFEDPRRLTIFQPKEGRLSVELKYLDLAFFVNSRRLLESRELGLEVDPDQDIQTLHGFMSMIALREVRNHQRRSIITANGPLEWRRRGIHLEVKAKTNNDYYKFSVDNILGRLSCAPEPGQLLFKGLLHALTSFVLPDGLTGRTGTEEAFAILSSGQCQPWQPLDSKSISVIQTLATLGPQREYYPSDKRHLQRVVWGDNLSGNTQSDFFYTAVRKIFTKSNQLCDFSLNSPDSKIDLEDCHSHLRNRGKVQESRYQRTNDITKLLAKGRDYTYKPRDRDTTFRAVNTCHISRIVWSPNFRVNISRELKSIMAGWNLIGGFKDVSQESSITLNSLVENHISLNWGAHLQFCKEAYLSGRFKLIFRLAMLAFSENPDMDMIKMFAAIGRTEELNCLSTPVGSSFNITEGDVRPNEGELARALATICPEYTEDPKLRRGEQASRRKAHDDYQASRCRILVRHLIYQWPVKCPSLDTAFVGEFDYDAALEAVKPKWLRAYENFRLLKYIEHVQTALASFRGEETHPRPTEWAKGLPIHTWKQGRLSVPSLPELLMNGGPSLGPLVDMCTPGPGNRRSKPTDETRELSKIINTFIEDTTDPARKKYGQDLNRSLTAYKAKSDEFHKLIPSSFDRARIGSVIQASSLMISSMLTDIKVACAEGDVRSHWLGLTMLWPAITPITILEQLRSTACTSLSHSMKKAIVDYGMSITILQKYYRMRDATVSKRDQNFGGQRLVEEYHNIGHQNWHPMEAPEWLLIQIEADILFRPEQVVVANAIIANESTTNAVLQLNMGKGKTSVILPMVAAILANEAQLARLVVPKALLLQTAQILQSRIGALVGRPVMHVPFSRRTPTSPHMTTLYEELHKRLMASQGVIITTPETVLSFKLSGLQKLRDGDLTTASQMIKMQGWITEYCRDVLDESDFTLAVKTQLIYPSGSQEALDGHPNRWLVVQNILALVEEHLVDVKRRHPKGITVTQRGNNFPTSHFLNVQAEDYLKELLIQDIADGKLAVLRYSGLTGSNMPTEVTEAVSDTGIDSNRILELSRCFTEPQIAFKCLHLLRGLLMNNILISCLKKRWNVQYGLHETRDPIAVPFEAKGIPHPQAEFGHPDAAIILTCLSYYYAGITLVQMRQGLRLVLDSDDPPAEFDRWTGGCRGVPETLRNVNSIDLDDEKQMKALWQNLRFSRNVLNHFMNNFVFPNHAKQFSVKLQASGWDIPQFSPTNGHIVGITTGFSGTNDNKWMLPLTIHQNDLPELHHTNAEVLTYLLQRGKSGYVAAMDSATKKAWSEPTLLHEVQRRGIRILVDAGAYILDMDNKTIAEQWLRIDGQAKAAVYFGSDNRAWVKYRERRKADAPLLATPFADKLEDCLVYLDQAHTRGTDMKFPLSAKGALTLSLSQTKDSTMQAAMRLRHLKTTQSILFVAPPEVNLGIQDVCKRHNNRTIDSADVVYWLLEQTCATNDQLRGLFFAQAEDFYRRMNSALHSKDFLENSQQRADYIGVLEQPERQTLQEMYGTRPSTTGLSATYAEESTNENASKQLINIAAYLYTKRRSANTFNGLNVLGEVEQEREVEFQVEEVRDTQKPVQYKALVFPGIHQELHKFAMSGKLHPEPSFRHAFTFAGETEIGVQHHLLRSSTRLFVSTEFEKTIELVEGQRNDSFMRPVEWILWSPSSETGIVIIREEAETLLSSLRNQMHPKVYLLTYAAPVTKAMEPLGRMSFYTIPTLPAGYEFPAWLLLEVGFFAGRLYLNFESWAAIAQQLQVRKSRDKGTQNHGKLVADDPRGFLLDWLTFRRRGHDILHTPMGYLCQGRQLTKEHAFFSEATVVFSTSETRSVDCESSASDVDDDEDPDESSSGEESDSS
ncbi:hypothetical protein PG984_013650 [Apiospora sp. TS-2023a]